MKKKICIIFSFLLICLLSLNHIKAIDSCESIIINAFINKDGSLQVEEKWNIEVSDGTEIYKVFNNMGEAHIKDFYVIDDHNIRYTFIDDWDIDADFEDKINKCGIIQDGDDYELCFGIGEYGHREYTFFYTIENFVIQYKDVQGFNYAFFSDLDFDVDYSQIRIDSDVDFNNHNSGIWGFGYSGSVIYDHGDILMESHGRVEKRMQLLMRINNGLFDGVPSNKTFDEVVKKAMKNSSYSYEDYKNGHNKSFEDKDNSWIITIVIIACVTLIGIPLIIYAIASTKGLKQYQFNDYQELNKDVNMFRDIPCDKDLYEFYYLAKKLNLITDQNKDGLIAAILLRWIQKGYITFNKEEDKKILFFKVESYSMDMNKSIPVENEVEKEILEYFIEASKENGLLEEHEFETWCRNNYLSIESWFENVEEYIETIYRNERLLTTEITYTKFIFKVKHDTDTYDVSVREKMEQILGLKKFLEEMSSINEKEVIEVKMWEEYLIFASILGIAEKVEEQLGRLCPQFNEYSHMNTIHTTRMIRHMSHSGVMASVSASQGSGGSSSIGGGGGFSGGGGGGSR